MITTCVSRSWVSFRSLLHWVRTTQTLCSEGSVILKEDITTSLLGGLGDEFSAGSDVGLEICDTSIEKLLLVVVGIAEDVDGLLGTRRTKLDGD
eukprot:c49394_g1_i1 orf=36-317(-)